MRYSFIAAFIVSCLIGPLPSRAEDQDVLATLRKIHPRLLLLDDDVNKLRPVIASDPLAKQWFEKFKSDADKTLTQPVSQRVLVGPRLLQVSRNVLQRVSLLAGMYRITGERKYADRARDEMLAAAAFEDWHPPHFLDVAEMTNAMAIGYDWLYDVLTPQERATIKQAIVDKGLKPGLEVYAKQTGFSTMTSNWNQVCNGGLTVGALAIADEDPDIARQIIENGRKSIPLAMAHFAPDGGCDEGPAYWWYATEYTSFYITSLQTALGTDLGFLKTPGFGDTAMFRIQSTGPTNLAFNFSDAGPSLEGAFQMFWFARQFDNSVFAVHERLLQQSHPHLMPFHLFWFNPAGTKSEIEKLPTAAMFKRVNVAFMRSDWDDRDAAFVGFKGGDNAASHAHADLGTFVYDVDGVRWALDLGPDDYNLPGYFGKARFSYYRLRTEGHNTLTIGTDNQNIGGGVARIVAFSPKAGAATAVVDLTAGYAPKASRVQRGVQLVGRQLLVEDEVEADKPLDFVWNFHTDATLAIDATKTIATLTHGDKKLVARILEPAGATFATMSANPAPPQAQQPKVTNLVVRQPEKITSLRLVVLLTPQEDTPAEVKIQPLAKWIDGAAVGK